MHRTVTKCLGIVVSVCGLTACSMSTVKPVNDTDPYEKIRDLMVADIAALQQHQQARDQLLQATPAVDYAEPVTPPRTRLDGLMIDSLAINNGNIIQLLQALAIETETNLLLHPDVATLEQTITVNFNQVSAGIVFSEIMAVADLHGEIRDNVMRVNPFEERIYALDFIETNIEARFDMGGDVLGSNVASTSNDSNGLTGQFTLSGRGSETNNPYDALNAMVERMKSPNGRYALNRMSGSLYIKDKPSVIRNLTQMLDNLQNMMARQILIEARILEIQLDDSYQYGIDWALLSNNSIISQNANIGVNAAQALTLDTGFSISNANGFSGAGIVFSQGDWLGAVNLLNNFGEVNVISNPHIRARHGQPSMISVGRSNTFISKTETSTDTDSTLQTATIETDQVFDGLLLGVIPFVGDEQISLSIHPIKSDVDDESLNLVAIQNASVSLPRVDLKEMSTTIKLSDGDTVVLGGLIDRRKELTTRGVPGISSVPVLGWLFKNESYKEVIREFVIVMTVSVV